MKKYPNTIYYTNANRPYSVFVIAKLNETNTYDLINEGTIFRKDYKPKKLLDAIREYDTIILPTCKLTLELFK